SNLPPAIDDCVCHPNQSDAARGYGAAAECAGTMLDLIGIAITDFDIRDIQAKDVGNDLRKRNLVALAMRVSAHGYLSAACRVKSDLGTFRMRVARRSIGNFDGVRQANSCQAIALASFL